MPVILIVGATRGLGASLTKKYAEKSENIVYGTTRSSEGPKDSPSGVKWLSDIDLMQSNAGQKLASLLDPTQPIDSVSMFHETEEQGKIITAGYFATEDLTLDKGPKWEEEQRMYTTSSIAPVFIVHQLIHKGLLRKGSKVVLVSSESGSITLRHPKEGGGNYAHHASKAALNMVGKLLSLDLKDQGVIVSIVHPGFMRTEMTKGVGFDKFWDDGGDKAAASLINWIDSLDISKTGEYWAPRGPRE
ncbi:3-oxoacyl-reductase [Fusarium pseudoanthophilum]|uniref:3-oxoacyl-reductase n=1 Tax=Fusarium pseudoanthophilum TaxID=48495 RepID=A0A8H5KH88_9HYPO|nr:3-oxoacyl-reductase [Fusarium pseudoanthophilum]